jgi:hypothetical protein
MRSMCAMITAGVLIAAQALAQPVAPVTAGPGASADAAKVDASMAHHDQAVARRAARTGHLRRAATAAHAARSASNAAAVNSANAGMVPR